MDYSKDFKIHFLQKNKTKSDIFHAYKPIIFSAMVVKFGNSRDKFYCLPCRSNTAGSSGILDRDHPASFILNLRSLIGNPGSG